MFTQFRKNFEITERKSSPVDFDLIINELGLPKQISKGLAEFLGEFDGAFFNKGIYRVYPMDRVVSATERMLRRYLKREGRVIYLREMGRQIN